MSNTSNRLYNALKNYKPIQKSALNAPPPQPLAAGSINSKSGLFRKFLSYRKKNPVTYIPHFPYTKKTDFQETTPIWRQRKDLYTSYNIPLDYQWSCAVIQDKKTGIVYNLFSINMLQDDFEPGNRDYKHLADVVLPTLKKHEEDLEYKILGWDWGYLKPSFTQCSDKFKIPGDQFLQFFEEENSYYYYPEPVYPIDYAEDFVEELEDDYREKNMLYWSDRNLTDNNLGCANRNHWI